MKWLNLKLVLLSLLFAFSSGVSLLSQEFISIQKTDWIIMKNLLKLQEKEISNLKTQFNTFSIEIESLKNRLLVSQNQLKESNQALETLQKQYQSLTDSISNYEKLLISTNKKAELQRILLIIIPLALTVLILAGIGSGIYIGWKLNDIF